MQIKFYKNELNVTISPIYFISCFGEVASYFREGTKVLNSQSGVKS